MYTYKCFFDGACSDNGNNGRMGVGAIIYENDEVYAKMYNYVGRGTNNRAEYEALCMVMKFIIKEIKKGNIVDNNRSKFIFYGDSKIVINQVNGFYKVNNETLSSYLDKINEYKECFKGDIEFIHVFREYNKEADELSKMGLKNK